MAKYRKIDPRIWNDAKFRDLSDDGKLLFFFLLTHPAMTSLGAMRHTAPGMAAELGWTTEGFAKPFAEALSKGLVKYDEKAAFVWLPNFIKYNQPDNPNVVKAWDSAVDMLPECDMLNELLQHVREFLKQLPEGFRKPFRKGLANQEQEQEQEQEEEVSEKLSVSHDSQSSLPCADGSEFVYDEIFIATARKAYPLVDIPKEFAKARAWLESNPGRKKTRRGMKKFFNGWLSRSQDDAEKKRPAGPVETTGRQLTAEDMKPAKWLREAKI